MPRRRRQRRRHGRSAVNKPLANPPMRSRSSLNALEEHRQRRRLNGSAYVRAPRADMEAADRGRRSERSPTPLLSKGGESRGATLYQTVSNIKQP